MERYEILKRAGRGVFFISAAALLAACATSADKPPTAGPGTAASSSDAGQGPQSVAGRAPVSKPLVAARSEAPRRPSLASLPPSQLAFPSALPQARVKSDQMVAHFIDVGQGDAVLLEFSCAAVLIDTGGETTSEVSGRARLRDYLRGFFTRRSDLANTLKLVVLSHPHRDHTDGVAALLASQPQIVIENIVDNGARGGNSSGMKGQSDLQDYGVSAGADYTGIAETDITSAAGMTNSVVDPVDCRPSGGIDPRIVVLWGRVDLEGLDWAKDANNSSVVVRVDFGSSSFLFTGDLEKEGIDAMLTAYEVDRSIFNADVLKVGHHGSHNATTDALIAAVTPKIAVIQAGDSTLSRDTFSAYSFAHPHQNTISKLLHGQSGVTMPRPAVDVAVGVRGRNPSTGAGPAFKTMTINRAIYTTGWDGNIAVSAHKDGTLAVETGY